MCRAKTAMTGNNSDPFRDSVSRTPGRFGQRSGIVLATACALLLLITGFISGLLASSAWSTACADEGGLYPFEE
jgi:hypothetical protein